MTLVAELDVQTTHQTRSDGELLAEVAADRSAESFRLLVERHSAMVLSVCLRQLGESHDAEDAAQAVFLVLWKKAASLRRRKSVAGWLHHVARNVCRNAKRSQQALRARERQAAQMKTESDSSSETWTDDQAILDEELDRLPEKYRLPIILFYLEDHTQ